MSFTNPLGRGPTVFVVPVGEAEGSRAAAAALACEGAEADRPALLIEVGGRPPRPTLLATGVAQGLARRLGAHLPQARVAARGQVCHLAVAAEPEGWEEVAAAVDVARGAPAVIHLPPASLQDALTSQTGPRPSAVLLRADLDRDRALVGLLVRELLPRGLSVAVLKSRLPWVGERRALFGALPAANPAGLPGRMVRRLLGAGSESGQALILALAGALALIAAALALVAIAGAVTGKGRAQRTADLVAISVVRSMRDDVDRLLAPPRLASGSPNPNHIDKRTYLGRARAAGLVAARENEVDADRVEITFPDAGSFAPVRAKAVITASLEVGGGEAVQASAEAEAAAPYGSAAGGATGMASGGGYGGPLVYRDGEGMRPDVAAAYDRMTAAARADGLALIVVSGFRSDAEQAALFAAHPDPTWVAPPGHSLHRCATELDLGPASAYAWLAANAARFGFAQRYSWEPWHYGFATGPEPCSAAGETSTTVNGAAAGSSSVPAFVPAQFRPTILRAAARWGVAPALLAGQLMAESGFDPNVGSPAGAQGIAQFMPSTAAAYGLRNPYDPEEAIDAEAHLMADLLRQFGSPELALAAYNAGPAPVEACHCIPPYPETQAYVTRILAMIGGPGLMPMPSFEVRLVA
ncbi:MAG TPA: transglycosylase SLT domain-containing protein [Solirubrobacterales bacterium]|nr:transglycosylase SLT domain-containing protein [Solirubrobacterales bacterium]